MELSELMARYRVKTTLKEVSGKDKSHPYDYRVTKLELLISGSETSDALSNSNIKSLKTISGTKLLKGVEKSYDKGVKLLDASEKESTNRYRLDDDEPNFNAEESEIVAQAKKDGSFMKAPNGKPTRLNAKQWAQVRTKSVQGLVW
jgi:hypothetical protein